MQHDDPGLIVIKDGFDGGRELCSYHERRDEAQGKRVNRELCLIDLQASMHCWYFDQIYKERRYPKSQTRGHIKIMWHDPRDDAFVRCSSQTEAKRFSIPRLR